jgi:hypothetical protein
MSTPRVDSMTHLSYKQPYLPELTLTLCKSRLYPPSQGLRVLPQALHGNISLKRPVDGGQDFSCYFCMMIEESGSRSRAGPESGSIHHISVSGSGRPKNHVAPVDPDPEHCLKRPVGGGHPGDPVRPEAAAGARV